MIRGLLGGAILIATAFLYTRDGGQVLGSRVASPQPHFSLTSIETDVRGTQAQVTVRNHQSHPARGEVDYIVLDGDSDKPVYRSPSTSTPLLDPGAETTVTVELRQKDLTSAELRFQVRERLVYVDEEHFDRSRVTPVYSLVVIKR